MFRGRKQWRRLLVGLVATACSAPAALLPVSATATPAPTRAEYVERVEPICKQETKSHENILQGVEQMVRRGELHRAAPHLSKAAVALRMGMARIAAVPQPTADAARLKRWLGYGKESDAMLYQMAAALRAGKRGKTEALAKQILHKTKQANAAVVGLEFVYCRVSPSRFA